MEVVKFISFIKFHIKFKSKVYFKREELMMLFICSLKIQALKIKPKSKKSNKMLFGHSSKNLSSQKLNNLSLIYNSMSDN